MPEHIHVRTQLAGASWLLFSMALGALILQGCTLLTFAPNRPEALSRFESYSDTQLDEDVRAYYATTDPGEKTRVRDRIVYKVAAAIDADFERFANGFFVEQGYTDTVIDVALIGLGSAGALAGGAGVKAALAAASAGTSGARASFAKNFFKEKGPEIIRARMNALRAKQWAVIYQKLGNPAALYSLEEAGRDLPAYYNAGTVKAAFDDIVAESGAKDADAKEQLAAELNARFGAPITAAEDKPAYENLQKRLNQLQHGVVDKNGRVVSIADRNAVACQILKEFDAKTYATCADGQFALGELMKDRTDRETTRRLGNAFNAVISNLP